MQIQVLKSSLLNLFCFIVKKFKYQKMLYEINFPK